MLSDQNWSFMHGIMGCMKDVKLRFWLEDDIRAFEELCLGFVVVVVAYIGCLSLGVGLWFEEGEGVWVRLCGDSKHSLNFFSMGVFFVMCYELMVSLFSSLNCILFKSVIFIFHTGKKYQMCLYGVCCTSFTVMRSVSPRHNVNIK